MGKLLLITGDLATGKSTFGEILSRRYETAVFYKDHFKEILGDTIGFSNRAENLKLSAASGALMGMVFTQFCKVNKNLILESNFRLAELEKLHKTAQAYGYQVLTLVLRGDLEILHSRFLHRLYHENRHAVHACGGFEDFATFQSYVEGQRDLQIPGEALEIKADSFDYQHDEALLARLDGFMGLSFSHPM